MNRKEILNKAIKRCNGEGNWDNYDNIYPFATENISGYISEFNLNDHSLLTVGSSGDQALNVLLLGANDVTVLDINPFTAYYYYLKMAAILELDINEYLYFCRNGHNLDIFNKIKGTLKAVNNEAYMFWNNLFKMYNSNVIKQALFSKDRGNEMVHRRSNPYLSNEFAYIYLRDILKKIEPKFIIDDIGTVNFDKRYDNIWLSNILTDWYSIEGIRKIFIKYNEYLNDNGMMLLSYLYDFDENTCYNELWADIYDLELIKREFSDEDIKLLSFPSTEELAIGVKNYSNDSALIYKKK